MTRQPNTFLCATLCLAIAVFGLVPLAFSQIDTGSFQMFQEDRLVGVAWRPEGSPDACEYKEYRYLCRLRLPQS